MFDVLLQTPTGIVVSGQSDGIELALKDLLLFLSFCFVLANFIYARVAVQEKLSRELAETKEALEHLVQSLSQLRTDHERVEEYQNTLREQMPKIDLFWVFVRENFPKMLMQHGTPERDILLDKLTKNALNYQEAIDLRSILDVDFEHLSDKKSGEAMINRLTLYSLHRVIMELEKGRNELDSSEHSNSDSS